MRYKEFGSTGLELSEISVGTWALGGKDMGPVDEKDAIEAIHTMIDCGVNFIDTAPTYGKGDSETIVGKALASGKRSQVTLLTKCGIRWEEGPKNFKKGAIRDSSHDSIIKQIDESLMRLQTDYIDIYLIHWPDVNTPLEETANTLKELKKAGKIRFSGISNFEDNDLEKLYDLGVLDVIQFPYSMVNRSQEQLLKKYHEKGVATMGYGSLGAGILTGSIRELPHFEPGDARLGFYDFFVEPKFSRVMELLEVLDDIALKRQVPVAQVTINWTVQHNFINTSLTGVRNAREAVENTAAMAWQLTADEIHKIDQAVAQLDSLS